MVLGDFGVREMQQTLAAMHDLTANRGYLDLDLDFSKCTSAFSGQMLGLAANVQNYLFDDIDTSLTLPEDQMLRRLFINTNWAHLIDFRRYQDSSYRGYSQVPAIKFTDAAQQDAAASVIMKAILSSLTGFDRDHLKAIEWSVNEVMDNVLNHAQSRVGGFVQVTNYRQRQQIEFSVCDAGLGIPATLRESRLDSPSETELVRLAIEQGVTRDKAVGQGNGLYGTWRISRLSGGRFELYSEYAGLVSTAHDGLRIRRENIPFKGALITARIGYREPLDLREALRFGGREFETTDIVELDYEEDDDGNLSFSLQGESTGFGSRKAGEPVRRKLNNLARLAGGGQVRIDCADIPLMSSSYADEVFGKLFAEHGPIEFSRRFELRNLDPLVKDLIDRAILQRTWSGL